jgi:hypothetical protein
VVGSAKQAVVAQSELVAGYQLPTAGNTPEARHVIDEIAGTHDEIGNAEAEFASGAFGTKQPAKLTKNPKYDFGKTELEMLQLLKQRSMEHFRGIIRSMLRLVITVFIYHLYIYTCMLHNASLYNGIAAVTF